MHYFICRSLTRSGDGVLNECYAQAPSHTLAKLAFTVAVNASFAVRCHRLRNPVEPRLIVEHDGKWRFRQFADPSLPWLEGDLSSTGWEQ